MSLLEKRLKSRSKIAELPSWVSDKNVTQKVYDQLILLKDEKLAQINNLNISSLKTKKNYQISAGELSRATGIAKTTLISTSSYSKAVKKHLDSLNVALASARDKRVKGYESNQQTVKQRKKNVIIDENKRIKAAYEELLQKNTSEQVKLILNNLSLPLRARLGIK